MLADHVYIPVFPPSAIPFKRLPDLNEFHDLTVRTLYLFCKEHNTHFTNRSTPLLERSIYAKNLSLFAKILAKKAFPLKKIWAITRSISIRHLRHKTIKKVVAILAERNQFDAYRFLKIGKKGKDKDWMRYQLVKSFSKTHFPTACAITMQIENRLIQQNAYRWIAIEEAKQHVGNPNRTIALCMNDENKETFLTRLEVAKIEAGFYPKKLDSIFRNLSDYAKKLPEEEVPWALAKTAKTIALFSPAFAMKWSKPHLKTYPEKKNHILKKIAIASHSIKRVDKLTHKTDQAYALLSIADYIRDNNPSKAQELVKRAVPICSKHLLLTDIALLLKKRTKLFAQLDPEGAIFLFDMIYEHEDKNLILLKLIKHSACQNDWIDKYKKRISDLFMYQQADLMSGVTRKHEIDLKPIDRIIQRLEPVHQMTAMTRLIDYIDHIK